MEKRIYTEAGNILIGVICVFSNDSFTVTDREVRKLLRHAGYGEETPYILK
jgi:hypothetical protein